jgi:hypothetical protein
MLIYNFNIEAGPLRGPERSGPLLPFEAPNHNNNKTNKVPERDRER